MVNYRISDGRHAKGYKVFKDGSIVVPDEVQHEYISLSSTLSAEKAALETIKAVLENKIRGSEVSIEQWWRRCEEDLNVGLVHLNYSYTATGGEFKPPVKK